MTWRAERNPLGMLLLVCPVVGAIFVWLMPGCAPRQARTAADQEKCLARADAHMQAQVAIQCSSATYAECPNKDTIDAAWLREAEACK